MKKVILAEMKSNPAYEVKYQKQSNTKFVLISAKEVTNVLRKYVPNGEVLEDIRKFVPS